MSGATQKEYRVFGPPGTGKTTFLTAQIKNAAQRRGSAAVFVASFTRAAASELVGRGLPIPRHQVGTLHSHAYKSLGTPPIAQTPDMIAEWNKFAPQYSLSGGATSSALDEPFTEHRYSTTGDELMADLQVYRAKMTDDRVWKPSVRAFSSKWNEFKSANDAVDFTDMIEYALRDVRIAPGNPSVGFVDEVQDMTALELALVRSWGASMDIILMAGDDDQCQPAGTMVLTTKGYVDIADLNPEAHRIVSYNRSGASLAGLRKGYLFEKASRPYAGRMLTVEAGGKRTKCTPDHLWLAKWNDGAKQSDKHVVYLMRRGDWYRVGWCRLFKSDGGFHLGHRARIEKADAVWILSTFEDRTAASVYESYVAAHWGLPTATFEPVVGAKHLTATALHSLFTTLDSHAMEKRANNCLMSHGRFIGRPIWTPERAYAQRGGRSIMKIEASNLLDGMMQVPVHEGGARTRWADINVGYEPFNGTVYSLSVDTHETYIADGIATHNCIYNFKGATPDAFLTPPVPDNQKRILSQSYRVPEAVHRLSQAWISKLESREPKDYKPRVQGGEVRRLSTGSYKYPEPMLKDAEQYLAQGRTVMFLASCSYMLDPMKAVLRKEGIPFHNPFRRSRGDWNPLHGGRGISMAQRLLSFLAPEDIAEGEWGIDLDDPFLPSVDLWTHEELKRWVEIVKAKGIFQKGAKTQIESLDVRYSKRLALEHMAEYMEHDSLERAINLDVDWLEKSLLAPRKKAMQFPLDIYKRRGKQALIDDPQIIIGTIHSVKGGQADVVYLMPDLSRSGMIEWVGGGLAQDSVRRMFYVGMTRAFETLVLCQQGSPFYALLEVS